VAKYLHASMCMHLCGLPRCGTRVITRKIKYFKRRDGSPPSGLTLVTHLARVLSGTIRASAPFVDGPASTCVSADPGLGPPFGDEHRPFEWGWRAVRLCSPFLRWGGRLCRRWCAAVGCARAVLVWGGVYWG